MSYNKLSFARIQPWIEQPLNLWQIDAAVFGIRVITMHEQREKRKRSHPCSRKASLPSVLLLSKLFRSDR
jgi:hypothetical protein